MNKLIYIAIVLLASATFLAASEEQSEVKEGQSSPTSTDLNQGIEIQIERDEPVKRPLTRLISSAVKGVGRLAKQLGSEVGTYAGVVAMGTYDVVKNTASIGANTIKRTVNRIAHPRGGPMYEKDQGAAASTQTKTDSSELEKAATKPDELTSNQE